MITLEGESYRLCNGVSRRAALRVGALGMAGLSLPNLLQSRAAAGQRRGTARSIIMVHLGGGPSHVDTYDPKPEAPVEIRGEFKAIGTNVPGIQICERFPMQAKMMDRLAILRSVHRVLPEEHASSLMCTGYGFTERRAAGDKPSIGAVLARLCARPDSELPPYVSLRGYNSETGLGAAHLGATCEPLVYDGPGREDLQRRIPVARLDGRRRMLDRINGIRREMDAQAAASQNVFSQRALEIISSSATYDALDVSKEDEKTRKRYPIEHFLRARRLVEAGVLCTAIEVGGWDTHGDNFPQLKRIMPPLDQSLAALLDDLKDRGLDRETIVIVWGEFGRTPRVNGTAGRDHWPAVMSAMIAGGGLKMGQVIGATDAGAGEAVERPVRVREIVATLYHALGIDPETVFIDQQARPIPLIPDAAPMPELIG